MQNLLEPVKIHHFIAEQISDISAQQCVRILEWQFWSWTPGGAVGNRDAIIYIAYYCYGLSQFIHTSNNEIVATALISLLPPIHTDHDQDLTEWVEAPGCQVLAPPFISNRHPEFSQDQVSYAHIPLAKSRFQNFFCDTSSLNAYLQLVLTLRLS